MHFWWFFLLFLSEFARFFCAFFLCIFPQNAIREMRLLGCSNRPPPRGPAGHRGRQRPGPGPLPDRFGVRRPPPRPALPLRRGGPGGLRYVHGVSSQQQRKSRGAAVQCSCLGGVCMCNPFDQVLFSNSCTLAVRKPPPSRIVSFVF